MSMTKYQLESQIIALEDRLTVIRERIKEPLLVGYLQLKQDRKSIAIIRNKIKGLKKQVKLLAQLDLF